MCWAWAATVTAHIRAGSGRIFREEMEEPHCSAVVSYIRVARDLEVWKGGEGANWIGKVKYLQVQL